MPDAQPKPNPAGEIYSPSPWPVSETEVGQPDVLAQIDEYVVAAGARVVGRGRDGLTLTERATQPKPTTAAILAQHDPDLTSYDAGDLWGCRGCEWRADRDVPSDAPGSPWEQYAQHQADMLAAEGYPTTAEALAEHDRQVLRDAALPWLSEQPPGEGVDDWGRGWLACRDAMVYDIGTTQPDRIEHGERA